MGEPRDPSNKHIPAARDEVELTDAQRLREEMVFSTISVFLSPIPYLGAAFNELRQVKANREKERLSSLVEELRVLMEEVSKEAVNWDYLRSETFQDFFIRSLETALRTRDRKKIAFVAQILKGAIISFEEESLNAAEEYLYLISDLTPSELRVALSVYKARVTLSGGEENADINTEGWKVWAEKASSDIGLAVADLRFALGRIVASGLLDRVTTMGDRGELVFTEPERDEVGFYRITPAFEKLMAFVEQDAEEN